MKIFCYFFSLLCTVPPFPAAIIILSATVWIFGIMLNWKMHLARVQILCQHKASVLDDPHQNRSQEGITPSESHQLLCLNLKEEKPGHPNRYQVKGWTSLPTPSQFAEDEP